MSAAARNGPFACLYVIEPGLWQQPDMAASHYHFIVESLRSLYAALRVMGGQLLILHGDIISVLNALYDHSPFHTMHSHEETGNGWTYERDRQVAVWCLEKKCAMAGAPPVRCGTRIARQKPLANCMGN